MGYIYISFYYSKVSNCLSLTKTKPYNIKNITISMAKKLRILAASDIHGESRLAKKLADKAEKEKVDLVILCGDITGWVETKDIIKPFKDKKKKVLIIPGNHDSFATVDFLAELYGVRNIHGYAVKYDNIGYEKVIKLKIISETETKWKGCLG